MLPTSEKCEDFRSLGSASTWQELAEHWLQFQCTADFETQERVKRTAAVRRWRGVEAERPQS